ncbi:MAG: PHP domain-containing protein, partial [Flavobacteriales bacterium]
MFLNLHSWFSLRFGVIKPEELLVLCRDMGVTRTAFTDINNTSACLDFLRMGPKYGIEPVTGIDFRNGAQCCYVGLAVNNAGFQTLNAHLSAHLHTAQPFDARAPQLDDTVIIYPLRAVLSG